MLLHDTITIALLGMLVLAAVGFSARLLQAGGNKLVSRKLLHVMAIGCCAFALGGLHVPALMIWITALVYPLLAWLVSRKKFQHEDTRPAWGILWFPPAMCSIWYFSGSPAITAAAMGVLAISDAAAALIGASLGRMEFTLTGDKKSIPGSIAFFITALAFLAACRSGGMILGSNGILLMAALCGTLLEAMGSGGRDNFFVPVGVALALSAPDMPELTLGAWLILPLCYLLFRLGWLSASGAVAVWCLAMGIVACAGAAFLLPPLVFLVLGTLMGKLPGKKSQDSKQGKARDHLQVWCNGGVALLALWLGGTVGPLLFLISIAISCADTCSSEWGTRFGKITVHPFTLKRMSSGESGGMSLAGTMAALPAAACIALFADDTQQLLWVSAAGFAGMWLDSLLGATIQAKFKTPEGAVAESFLQGYTLQSGWRFVDNDLVNILSNALTTTMAAFLILAA